MGRFPPRSRPAPVIHRAAGRCQPNPQELAIFQRI